MLNKYEVGQTYGEFMGKEEGLKFDMTDMGAVLVLNFNKPTAKEVEEIRKGSLKFGMLTKQDIIFLLVKFDNIPWMDTPYTVHLSKQLTMLSDIEDEKGYGCNIMLVDTSTGEVKAIRLISFNTRFSKKLKSNIEEQKKKEFNLLEYDLNLFSVYKNYTTKQLVGYSEIDFTLK